MTQAEQELKFVLETTNQEYSGKSALQEFLAVYD